jgi:hypothetical protein
MPGVLAYGATEDETVAHVQALALRVVADRLEHNQVGRDYLDISFKAASHQRPRAADEALAPHAHPQPQPHRLDDPEHGG